MAQSSQILWHSHPLFEQRQRAREIKSEPLKKELVVVKVGLCFSQISITPLRIMSNKGNISQSAFAVIEPYLHLYSQQNLVLQRSLSAFILKTFISPPSGLPPWSVVLGTALLSSLLSRLTPRRFPSPAQGRCFQSPHR